MIVAAFISAVLLGADILLLAAAVRILWDAVRR